MNGCTRFFSIHWTKPGCRPWLVFSEVMDGVFCLPCALFANIEKSWHLSSDSIKKKWTKLGDTCRDHEALSYHIDALVAFANFKTTMSRPKPAVNTQRGQSRTAAIEINISVINYVAKVIHLWGTEMMDHQRHRET